MEKGSLALGYRDKRGGVSPSTLRDPTGVYPCGLSLYSKKAEDSPPSLSGIKMIEQAHWSRSFPNSFDNRNGVRSQPAIKMKEEQSNIFLAMAKTIYDLSYSANFFFPPRDKVLLFLQNNWVCLDEKKKIWCLLNVKFLFYGIYIFTAFTAVSSKSLFNHEENLMKNIQKLVNIWKKCRDYKINISEHRCKQC